MSTITRERIAELAHFKPSGSNSVNSASREEWQELARMALASLEAEPVADVVAWFSPNEERSCDVRLRRHNINPGPLYADPPAPAAIKDHQIRELVTELRDIAVDYHGTQQLRERIARAIRAALPQGGKS